MEKEKVDEEFIGMMLEIENSYGSLSKHEKVRIEQWSKKLCQVTANPLWKKNRNKYAKTLLQLVKLGSLQDPFTKIPPEGALPQFTGQVYVQPSRPRPKSSVDTQPIRASTPIEVPKSDLKYNETRLKTTQSYQLKPNPPQTIEKKTSEPIIKHNFIEKNNENYIKNAFNTDTKINITHKVNQDLIKLQTQLEIVQLNEKHLREEINKKNKKISEQADEIEFLKRENENLRMKSNFKSTRKEIDNINENKEFKQFLEKPREDKEFLNIEDISDNLRRLEKLQEDLNKNRFS